MWDGPRQVEGGLRVRIPRSGLLYRRSDRALGHAPRSRAYSATKSRVPLGRSSTMSATTPSRLDPPLLTIVWFLLALGAAASLMTYVPEVEARFLGGAIGLLAVALVVAVWRGTRAPLGNVRMVFRISAIAALLIGISLGQRLWNVLASA